MEDPVAEWRARWTQPSSGGPGSWTRSERSGPRSPWVYAGAAFGGTIAAIVLSLVVCIGGVIAIAIHQTGFDTTPDSLTYSNDTGEDVYLYECYERCEDYDWGFWIESGEEESLSLAITLTSSLIRVSDLEEHHLEGELWIDIVRNGFLSRVYDLKHFPQCGRWHPFC